MSIVMVDPVRRARAYLLRVAEPPAPELTAFIAEHGPVDAAARVRVGDIPNGVASETDARRHLDLVDADFGRAAEIGARLLTPEDADWPEHHLYPHPAQQNVDADVPAPPIALWVRGGQSLVAMLSPAVAVIGSRAATSYGHTIAADFGHHLAEHGVGMVSDAAFGIGGTALRAALAAGGSAVAVLANGIDVLYPVCHSDLLTRTTEHGLVISEYPPGTLPARHRFLARNKRLALMSRGTVVVEAGARSGSRVTVGSAAEFGRLVMAVPGPITSMLSNGTHALLRGGVAVPVASAIEILETLGIDQHSDPASPRERPA